jgi:hypothetical protein
MFRADECSEILLEGVEIRSRRSDPIGLEIFQDEFDFGTADVGRGEVKSVWVHYEKGGSYRWRIQSLQVTGDSPRGIGISGFGCSAFSNRASGAGCRYLVSCYPRS